MESALALAPRFTRKGCASYSCNGYSKWPVSAAFLGLFGLLLILHIGCGIKYKSKLSLLIIFAALLETLGYALKLATNWSYNIHLHVVWMVLVMTAPFFVNAYIHHTLSRLHAHFLPSTPLLRIGHLLLPILPFLDIIPFLLQLLGLLMSHGYLRDGLYRTISIGSILLFTSFIHQLLPLLIFFACLVAFTHKANRAIKLGTLQLMGGGSKYKGLTTALFWVIVALVIRVLFYTYNAGTDSDWLPPRREGMYREYDGWSFKYYEPFFIAFDAVPMFVNLLVLAAAHSGRYLRRVDARPRRVGAWGAWREWRRGGEYRLDAERGVQDDVRGTRTFVA